MSQQANAISNLDISCAELGQKLSKIENIDEKLLNDALAVLESQGPYAMFLFVKARHGKVRGDFCKECVVFLREIFGSKIQDNADVLQAIKNLAENLDDLLFASDLLRNALGYARFHLKAKEG